MTGRAVIGSKYAGETRLVTFDFISMVTGSATLSSATVVASVYSGNDASPSAVVSGSAVVVSPTTNLQINQLITGGVVGTIYLLTCSAITSGGETLVSEALLAIVPGP